MNLSLIIKYFTTLFLILLLYTNVKSQNKKNIDFIENKKQWNKNILYKAEINSLQLYLEKNCFTYNYFNEEDLEHSPGHSKTIDSTFKRSEVIHMHSYKVNFVNSLPNTKIFPFEQTIDYCNYFIGKDPSKWASKVRKFKVITYTDLYKNIDLNAYSDYNNFKYDFIINPSGNVNDIILNYEGVDKLYLKDGNLIIKTSVNEVKEVTPVAYQLINGEKNYIKCNYVLNKNNVTFQFPDGYDKNNTLIIDPTLIFATYSGSTADNWGYTATYDNFGNVFSGGIVFGTGYPTSVGAYQVSFAAGTGMVDVGIIKYNSLGTVRIYATYLGGSGNETPHSIIVNSSNELCIFGTTGSSDFPVSLTAFDKTFNGGNNFTYDYYVSFPNGSDIFVTRLSAGGDQLLASTYVGGTGNDGANFKDYINNNSNIMMDGNDSLYYNYADIARGEIITDANNNVYIGTTTNSTNFPITSGAFQTTNSGKQDGIIFKLDYNLSNMIWGSYIGGNGDDAIYSVDVDANYDVYIGGGTNSTNFPTTSGVYQPSAPGGSADGFISHIDYFGNLISSTYFGSYAYDQVYFVRTDKFKNIYVTGQTKAPGSTFIFNAIYNKPNSGQFITKFNNSLNNVIWSTRFGTGNGRPNISITAFAVDICDRIYLAGWGREWAVWSSTYPTWASIDGTKNMDITSNAYQSITDGQDFYIMVMKSNASSLDYATFIGEQQYSACSGSGHDHVDGGTSRFDKRGNIYESICASCGGCDSFPTYPNPGVWSNTNNCTWNCNNAVIRFSLISDFALADFNLPSVGCAPVTVNFTNNSLGATYLWDFGDGSPTSTAFNPPPHTYTQQGQYYVTLIATDPNTCNISDTITKLVSVLADSSYTLAPVDICLGQNYQIGLPPNSDTSITYHWYPSTGLNDITISNPFASPSTTTNYLLIMSNGVCSDSIFQQVVVHNNTFNVISGNNTTICSGDSILIHATPNGTAISYIWSSTNQYSDTLNNNLNDSTIYVHATSDTTFFVHVNGPYCQEFDTSHVSINIYSMDISTYPDTTICLGDQINIHVNSLVPSNNNTYLWTPTSSIVSGANTSNPLVLPTQNTTYYVTATNQHGCKTTDSVKVDIDNFTINFLNTQNTLCFGSCDGSLSVSANGISPYTYQWSNGITTNPNTNLCAGPYEVTVTDNIGCKKIINTSITQPTLLIANTNSLADAVCDSIHPNTGIAIVNPSGGTPSYTYLWSDGQTTPVATNLYAIQYFVTVTDTNGCDTVVSVQIHDQSNMVAALANNDSISCFGDCDGGAIANIVVSGIPPYSYIWNNGQTTTSISALCAGGYSVTVTDASNCVRVQNIYITQPDTIHTLINVNPIICNGDSTSAKATVYHGGTPPYNYIWDIGQTGQIANNLHPGTYYVYVTDYHGCKDTTRVIITEPAKLLYDSLITPSTCLVACNGKINLLVNGGVPPYNYLWSNGLITQNIIRLCSGNYKVTVTDNLGCKFIVEFFVGVSNQLPPVDVSADDYNIYIGQSTTLHGTYDPHYLYRWTPAQDLSNPNVPNPQTSPLVTTTYQLEIIDNDGCRNIDTVTIFVSDVKCREPYIYVPNAFTPNNDGNNDKLFVQSDVVENLYFAIYDRWGEILFETQDINIGWDGTYKGEKCEPAVFVYYLKATCIDKKEFIKKGNITLIR